MLPRARPALLLLALPFGSGHLNSHFAQGGAIPPPQLEPALHQIPTVAYWAKVLEEAQSLCAKTGENQPKTVAFPPKAPPTPAPVPSLLLPLSKAIQEVVDKKCQWATLSPPAQLLVEIIAPVAIPAKVAPPDDVLQETAPPAVTPTAPIAPVTAASPTASQLWRHYKARNWTLLQRHATRFLESQKNPGQGCGVGALMKTVAQARLARQNQDRTTFLERQREVVALMENTRCNHKLFDASQQEWQDFQLDNGLWLARLMWQKGQGAKAKPVAKKAYKRALQWERWPYVFEAQQVVYGQIGFERMGSVALAQGLENALKVWNHNGELADKARTWLRSRAAVAWYQARHFPQAQRMLEPIDMAMAKFWLLKIAVAQNSPPEKLQELLGQVSRLDPFSYHDIEARRLLNIPMPPPPPSQNATWSDVAPFLNSVAYRNLDTVALLALAFQKDAQQHTALWDLIYSQRFSTFPPEAMALSALYALNRNQTTQAVLSLTPLLVSGKFSGNHVLFRGLFPQPFGPQMAQAQQQCQVPPRELYALMRQESLFDPQAESPGVGALGLLQVMLATGRKTLKNPKLSRAQLLDIPTNLQAGACYFATLKARYNELMYAIGAYNAGEERMDAWVQNRAPRSKGDPHIFTEMVPFGETRIYIQKVLRNLAIYSWMEGGQEK